MVTVVLLKATLDALVAIGAMKNDAAMALMFFGFFVADIGAAWLLLVKP